VMSGCEFDARMVWTSDFHHRCKKEYCSCASNEVCENWWDWNNLCDRKRCVPMGESKLTDGVQAEYYYVAQGGTNSKCLHPWAGACDTRVESIDKKFAVRCCSDKLEWKWIDNCPDVWAGSFPYFSAEHVHKCQYMNWKDANDYCHQWGWRLCTAPELENNCAGGGGCGYDVTVVWSSTTIITQPPQIYPTIAPITMRPSTTPTGMPTQDITQQCSYRVSEGMSQIVLFLKTQMMTCMDILHPEICLRKELTRYFFDGLNYHNCDYDWRREKCFTSLA